MPSNAPKKNSLLASDFLLYSPLELLNLDLSNGKSTGDEKNNIWKQLNNLLSWENITNKGYQADLCPLLHFIINKKRPENSLLNRATSITPHKKKTELIGAKLKYSYYSNLSRNMRLLHALDNVLEVFNNERIPVIVLKGADLAQNAYPNIALRAMSDIDILVHKQDIQLADTAIKRLGYEIKQPGKQCHHSFHTTYVKMEDTLPVIIEIHWDLVNPLFFSEINLPFLWQRAEIITSAKHDYMTLCAEDSMLFLSWHGCRHGYSRLIWLYDISLLLKNNCNLNNHNLVENSKNFKLHNSLEFSLKLIDSCLYTKSFLEEQNKSISRYSSNKLRNLFIKIQTSKLENKQIKTDVNIFVIYLLNSTHTIIKHTIMRTLSKISKMFKH